ncbi:unnamed protein product [Rotaria magnacalcarata]|uniref:Uncharacterized protein n=1 Tax=Rotaria magnacalcarata TaxID=392030 RepID=A0A819DMM4_9BILA|nr:unnamed protein product [Rotaria magnacalcarata]CAF3837076.1 unnamed protein product [Rotaria magnacalcarata]
MCNALWYTLKNYCKNPNVYGLNQFNETHCRHRPVLLLHGAVGSWSYLGDLAAVLKTTNIPVFVINLGFGLLTEETRKKIFNKIEEIRKTYYQSCQKFDNESYYSSMDKESLCMTNEEISTIKLLRTS